MSLNKAIKHGKEHRRPYRGIQECFADCRPHGGCSFSLSNRMHSTRKRLLACEQDIASLNEPPVDGRVKVNRPWGLPYGITASQARANLARLQGWAFDEPPFEDLLAAYAWHGRKVGRQGKRRKKQ